MQFVYTHKFGLTFYHREITTVLILLYFKSSTGSCTPTSICNSFVTRKRTIFLYINEQSWRGRMDRKAAFPKESTFDFLYRCDKVFVFALEFKYPERNDYFFILGSSFCRVIAFWLFCIFHDVLWRENWQTYLEKHWSSRECVWRLFLVCSLVPRPKACTSQFFVGNDQHGITFSLLLIPRQTVLEFGIMGKNPSANSAVL